MFGVSETPASPFAALAESDLELRRFIPTNIARRGPRIVLKGIANVGPDPFVVEIQYDWARQRLGMRVLEGDAPTRLRALSVRQLVSLAQRVKGFVDFNPDARSEYRELLYFLNWKLGGLPCPSEDAA
jgi:hypothetical protein